MTVMMIVMMMVMMMMMMIAIARREPHSEGLWLGAPLGRACADVLALTVTALDR